MSDPGHVGPKMDPGWWDLGRQLVMFALAIFLVLYSVFTPGYDVPFLITAMVLFGIVPVDRAIDRYQRNHVEPAGPEGFAPPAGSAPPPH